MNRHITALLIMALGLASLESALAAPRSYTLSGTIPGAAGYAVMLVQKSGTTKSVTLKSSGAFSFKNLKLTDLKDASLQLIDANGRYGGPIVLATKGRFASTTFSGKATKASDFSLGRLVLRSGYASVKQNQLSKTVYATPRVPAVGGKPSGAGELGLVAKSRSSRGSGAEVNSAGAIILNDSNPGSDPDSDGIPSAFDADDDGDLILDSSDKDSAGTDVPMTGLFFDFRRTLNAHVRSGLTDEVIDAVVAGENVFSLTFFISLSNRQSNITGGYVECDDSLTYCRRNNPLAFHGGVSESGAEFRNKPWKDLLTSSGYPRMEKINLGGFAAIVASIQPRVGRSVFRPGDVYRINLTAGNSVASTRSFSLAPYFVSVPALKEYDAGFGTVAVDYGSLTESSGSIPGLWGNPIVLSSAGTLTLTFWRPQRQALRSDETGFYDWGNLNYGVIFGDAQASCAGLYSNVPSDLEEDPDGLGTGNSPFPSQGAKLSPLRDKRLDRTANANNTITFTVNLKQCATRAGLSAGEHSINLRAAGETVTGGESSAAQMIRVQIP